MAQYFGILDGADGVWGVRVPDLAGRHGGGATAAAALEDAVSAAREWAEHRVAKGLALPPATALEGIVGAGVEAGEVIVSVAVLLETRRGMS